MCQCLKCYINEGFLDLNELGMVKTIEEQQIRDEGYRVHAFNTLVSQQLSFHREIPDTRHKL